MQPPYPEETNRKLSNANVNSNIKKRRGYIKKEKVAGKQQVKRDAVTQSETKDTTTKSPSAIVSIPSAQLVSGTTRTPGPYRGKCLYQSRKCENERAVKRNGQPHNLCEGHRSKQNQHQRKFDAKKFLWKRNRESVSDEDAKVDEYDEPIVKRHRVLASQEGTPTVMTNSKRSTSMVAAIRGNYPPTCAAGFTPMSAPMMRLPLLQSPRRPILPTSPEMLYGSIRPVTTREAYLRDHMGPSGCRPIGGNQQSSRVSHHRPSLQQQATQRLPEYTHSELVAANILAQQQPYILRTALPTPASHSSDYFAAGPGLGAMIAPRMLPSLLVPRSAALSSSPYHRVNATLSSPAQRFASVAMNPAARASFCSVRSEGKALPPLMSFGRRKSPVSSLPVFKHPK